ncbi:putative transcription factor interactor and regulator CCHC(Zn) family [Helianthus annuus]|nr:putative transcription factor interactor and regulator CCHC(Zn) family [Helianthus annuus]
MSCTKKQFHSILYSKKSLSDFSIIMVSQPTNNSAANASSFLTSGIRATSEREEIQGETSTTLPCLHCTNEVRERRRFQRRCYYCNLSGHQIAQCKKKEEDEASQLIHLAINTGSQSQKGADDNKQLDRSSEFMVVGTDGSYWSDIWYVSKSSKRHYSGNINIFKRIKKLYEVETNTGECNFYFIQGIGVVEMISRVEKLRMQSVFYTPDIDRNVLSFDQLITQGYTVKFMGDKCKIYPTFSIPTIDKRYDSACYSKENEVGNKEKEEILRSETEYEKFKNDYLNSYFESLNITSEEPDWNVMILQAMTFNEFQDCKALMDMLEDDEYVGKYKFFIEKKFEDMIDWFLKVKLEIQDHYPLMPRITGKSAC